MTRYLLGRLGQGLLVLWAAYTLTFVILFVVPGDPVTLMLNPGGSANYIDPELVAELRHELGFDRPLVVQYADRLAHAVVGDFGTSTRSRQDVVSTIASALPETLEVAIAGLVLAVIGGFTIAVVATYLRRAWLRELLLALPPVGLSLPNFWVGVMLLQWFSFRLGWFPAFGNEGWRSVVLPAVTLAIPTAATIAQVLANSIATAWQQEFVQTALAKGASRLRVHLRHVLRNALAPVVTLLGLIVGYTVGGAVILEIVFSRTGVGKLMMSAVSDRDLPLIQGLVVLSSAAFVVVNLIVDLLYPLIDPRVGRVTSRAGAP
jgi:peptide/nickel transport system permease protein